MHATRVADVDAFTALAGTFLGAHEAEHNLALGLLGRLRFEPRLYGFDPTFVVAEDAGGVVGCLLRTPPHGVVLSRFLSLDAVAAVVDAVLEIHPELPGAIGPHDVVSRFATAWAAATGVRPRLAVRQRIHAATEVTELAAAPGEMREAGPHDIPTVLAWLRAFADEALGEAMHVEEAEGTYRRRQADPDGAWLIWDDGGPASLAAYGSPSLHGTRVGPVYTPPDSRGKGYATSLVARLTAERLAAGRTFCVLSTDLANPTANAIYERIGYVPVADWDQWLLRP